MDTMKKSDLRPNYYEMLSVIISHTVPKYLRQYFIECWNAKFPEQPWYSCNASGTDLVNAISEKNLKKKDLKKFNEYQDKLHRGNEEEWDTDILVHIMIDFGLDICDNSVKADLVKLRKASSQFASFTQSKPCLPDHSDKMIADITNAARKLFQKDAYDEISTVLKSEIKSPRAVEQCMHPNTEMKSNIESVNVVESDTEHKSGKLLIDYSVPLRRYESPLILILLLRETFFL